MIKTEIVANGYGACTPKYLVVHSTANVGATARNHLEYWGSGDAEYYAHYVSDWTAAYHAVRDNRLCYHVGNANSFTIGIEICESAKADQQKKGIEIAAQACAEILKEKGWGTDKLITHDYCTKTWGGSDHTDPYPYFRRCGITWEQFKAKVQAYMTPDGWQTIGGKRYYFKNGKPVKWTQYIGGKRYYFNGAGVMQTGWITWKDDGSKSYFDKDGVCCKGWQKIGGKWYYFDPKTYKAVKWSQTINGKRYYFNGQGIMHTGWLQWNKTKTWSYFKPDGSKASLTLAKDGSVIVK